MDKVKCPCLSRSQCCWCYYWLRMLLARLFLSLWEPGITRLTCFLCPLWKDPDGSACWLLTRPQGHLLMCGTEQLDFVTPPFQSQIAIARTAESTLQVRTLPSLSGFWHLGHLHQYKMRKLREVSTDGPHKHKPRTCGDATIIQNCSTAKDHSSFVTLERHSNEVTVQKASFDTNRCENGPFFLMVKAFKWRNL